MFSSRLQSLRFRIAAAVLLLALLMLSAALHTLAVVREQRTLDVLLHTAGQLQLTVQTLEKQSLNYLENAPRDYPTYYRDVKLYYEDLKTHIATFDMFTDAFMNGSFGPAMTGLDETIHPDLDDAMMSAVRHVEKTWKAYRETLMDKLGPETDEPRLEWAAEFIAGASVPLEAAADQLASVVRYQAASRVRRITTVNAVLLAFYVLVSGAVVLWFFRRVINPLSATADAFRQVAQGDFGHQIPVSGKDEIASLTASFNRLSRRIHGLVELTTRIQRGSNLDETLGHLAEDFHGLVPLDWVAMLFTRDDGRVQTERVYCAGQVVESAPVSFPGDGGVLAAALDATDPVHAPIDTGSDTGDTFAAWLGGQGVRDAILLPVREQTPQQGVLVIASRQPQSYTADHLELIRNIGLLVSLSFARTVQLAERARLAAIGEFTSGIVHELRTPLATIGLALDYLRGQEMGIPAARRVELAVSEVERMGRLLSDVLQYARPLVMNTARVDAAGLLRDTLERHPELGADNAIRIDDAGEPAWIDADADRLTQVVLNLTRNALEASPPGAAVLWKTRTRDHGIELSVANDGPPIPEPQLARLFEPFFTTKAGGTGLGLSIVKRIVEGHGGTITVTSSAGSGTRFKVRLPAETTVIPGSAAVPAADDRRAVGEPF